MAVYHPDNNVIGIIFLLDAAFIPQSCSILAFMVHKILQRLHHRLPFRMADYCVTVQMEQTIIAGKRDSRSLNSISHRGYLIWDMGITHFPDYPHISGRDQRF